MNSSVEPTDESTPLAAVWQLVIHGLAWGALLLVLTVIMPRQAVVYRDFNLKLPALTEFVLSLSQLTRDHGWLLSSVGGALLVADGVLLYLLQKGPETRGLAGLWFWLVLLTALVGLALTGVAYWLPLQELYEALSK